SWIYFQDIFSKIGKNAFIHVEPAQVFFQIKPTVKMPSLMRTTLMLINVARSTTRVNIVPPYTKYFSLSYKVPQRFVPGARITCRVHFKPTEHRYYEDAILVHTEDHDRNLIIPLYGYPVIEGLRLPQHITLPPVPLGHTWSHTILLKCSSKVDFNFMLQKIQDHASFTVSPDKANEGQMAQWLECEFIGHKVCGSNPISASRLQLSKLGQPGSLPAITLPSGGMATRHRKSVTDERISQLKHWRVSDLRCKVTLEFRLLQTLPACPSSPGLLQARTPQEIRIEFTPTDYTTCRLQLMLKVSQFNFTPQFCTVIGCSEPGLESESTSLLFSKLKLSIRFLIESEKLKETWTKNGETSDQASIILPPLERVAAFKRVKKPGKPGMKTKPKEHIFSYSPTDGQVMEFEAAVRQDATEERRNQVRWQTKLGGQPLTPEQRDKTEDEWIQAWNNYFVSFKKRSDFAEKLPFCTAHRGLQRHHTSGDRCSGHSDLFVSTHNTNTGNPDFLRQNSLGTDDVPRDISEKIGEPIPPLPLDVYGISMPKYWRQRDLIDPVSRSQAPVSTEDNSHDLTELTSSFIEPNRPWPIFQIQDPWQWQIAGCQKFDPLDARSMIFLENKEVRAHSQSVVTFLEKVTAPTPTMSSEQAHAGHSGEKELNNVDNMSPAV
ncbi:hypothetical protein T265_14717, partial [Opisthorchis viverrini]